MLDSGLFVTSKNEPSAACAARLDDNAGFRNFRTYDLNTANVGSSRDFSHHVARGSNRPCYAVHPDDSACPFMFWVHSSYIAKVCDTLSHLHVRVTSMVRCCLVAHSGDNVCLRIFLTRGLHLAAGMGRHVGQWTVQCDPRESLVDTSLGDSNVDFHSQCAAGLRQARELGRGERNTQDRVLCRHAQLHGEREDALSEPCALLQREFLQAHPVRFQSAHAGVSLFFVE